MTSHSHRLFFLVLFSLLISPILGANKGSNLEIVPRTFDFGWSPDDAKITTNFRIRNKTTQLIPIVDVQPSCGCTATDFSPADLSANDEMNISLTFNTFGYGGRRFFKKTNVKTDEADQDHKVFLKGHVTNPDALLLPVGNGIVQYDGKATEAKQKVQIENRSDEFMRLKIISKPESWARVQLMSNQVKPNKPVPLFVTVNPPYTEKKFTSVTVEGTGKYESHRMTVAIRVGAPEPRRRRIQAPPSNQLPYQYK